MAEGARGALPALGTADASRLRKSGERLSLRRGVGAPLRRAMLRRGQHLPGSGGTRGVPPPAASRRVGDSGLAGKECCKAVRGRWW